MQPQLPDPRPYFADLPPSTSDAWHSGLTSHDYAMPQSAEQSRFP